MAVFGTLETTVQKDLTFLQKHERLLLGVLVICVVLFIGNKVINYLDAKDTRQAAVSAQVLAAQVKVDAALKAQADKDHADYQTAIADAQKVIQAQGQAILALNNQLAKQKQADQTMPLPELATRWADLAGLGSTEIAAVPSGITVTESGARKTTQTLEEVPVLQKELDSEKQIVVSLQNQSQACQKSLDSQIGLVAGLQTQIKDADKACKDEITKVKADARKSKVKIGFFGIISGVILKSFLHF